MCIYFVWRSNIDISCQLFWHFYLMQWLRCVCHPPTWNIGGHLGRLHNLWINIGDCGQRKEAQGRVRPSSRWLGSVLFTKAPYLLDKPLTKASPFFFGSVSLPALQPFTLQKDSADVQSGVHIQQAHGMCPLYIWRYAKCWAYRRGQNRYLPYSQSPQYQLIRGDLEICLSWKKAMT